MTTHLKTKYVLGVAIALMLIATSCDNREVYHAYQDVENASWGKTDSLDFVIDTTAVVPGAVYDIHLETVNNAKFPYQNLWLFVRSNIIQEKIFRQDTIQIELADLHGKWLGSGFGSYYQSSMLLWKSVVLSEKRNYKILVVHGMRDEPLAGIEKIGLRVSRVQ